VYFSFLLKTFVRMIADDKRIINRNDFANTCSGFSWDTSGRVFFHALCCDDTGGDITNLENQYVSTLFPAPFSMTVKSNSVYISLSPTTARQKVLSGRELNQVVGSLDLSLLFF